MKIVHSTTLRVKALQYVFANLLFKLSFGIDLMIERKGSRHKYVLFKKKKEKEMHKYKPQKAPRSMNGRLGFFLGNT